MRTIREKRALVTGAASGIGRAIALQLAGEGANLLLVDINTEELAETVAACQSLGAEVVARPCDVSRPDDISAVVEDLLDDWGGIDLLVNNAGITYYGHTHRMADAHWDRLLQVNLHAHIQFTRKLLPVMLEQPEAHVVNICSMFGLVGMPKLAAYCVSKFGLVGFSESLRNEYGRDGLGVTTICPGFVDTRLFTNGPLHKDVAEHKIPPKILCTTAEKVARATIKAIRHNRRMVVIEPFARGLVATKRFLPGLLDFIFHLGRNRRLRKKAIRLRQRSGPATFTPGVHSPVDGTSDVAQKRAA